MILAQAMFCGILLKAIQYYIFIITEFLFILIYLLQSTSTQFQYRILSGKLDTKTLRWGYNFLIVDLNSSANTKLNSICLEVLNSMLQTCLKFSYPILMHSKIVSLVLTCNTMIISCFEYWTASFLYHRLTTQRQISKFYANSGNLHLRAVWKPK